RLDFRFSNFYSLGWYHFLCGYDELFSYITSPASMVDLTLRDCNFHGGRVGLGLPDDGQAYGFPADLFYGASSVTWQNNLFDGATVYLNPSWYWTSSATNCDLAFEARNNLFRDSAWFIILPAPASAGNWTIEDNLFHKV